MTGPEEAVVGVSVAGDLVGSDMTESSGISCEGSSAGNNIFSSPEGGSLGVEDSASFNACCSVVEAVGGRAS